MRKVSAKNTGMAMLAAACQPVLRPDLWGGPVFWNSSGAFGSAGRYEPVCAGRDVPSQRATNAPPLPQTSPRSGPLRQFRMPPGLYRRLRSRRLLLQEPRRQRQSVTERMPGVKKGSIEDVNAVGNRDIGARGMGNWYSTETEIKIGKSYSMEVEKSTKLINDPVITEYVNRIGQNIVKNSDCKVPFTIKVIDSDEVNAMALPGGFFYVNTGLILAADEEAELAGVMAHETAHVCAHHAMREQTRANYAQIASMAAMIAHTLAGLVMESTRRQGWRFRSPSCSFRANSRPRPTTSACSTCIGRDTIRRLL